MLVTDVGDETEVESVANITEKRLPKSNEK